VKYLSEDSSEVHFASVLVKYCNGPKLQQV
jgi:hypothetical protein